MASLLDEIESDLMGGRPLADTLRKCILLGGRAGSVELREWATRELRGYGSDDQLPAYRVVRSGIFVDAVSGNTVISGQQIAASAIPEFAREAIKDEVSIVQGIAEVEALARSAADKGSVRLGHSGALDVARIMDHESGNPYQHITALYWKLTAPPLEAIVDQVRTTLTELVAEMRAGMPRSDAVPSAAVADQAVSVAVHGNRARVTLTTARSGAGGHATVNPATPSPSRWWTRSRTIGAIIVGVATVGATAIAWLQLVRT